MNNVNIILIFILIAISTFFIYREYRYRLRIKETINILDEIIKYDENIKIHVKANEYIAPLIFKINEIIDYYEKGKIKSYKLEQSRKQMLINLSHDVRTPLASVLGYLDALCSGVAGEESDDYLLIAQSKAYALKEYIEELFTIAQIDADELNLTPEEIDIYELLRSEFIGWIPTLQHENIAFEVNIPDEEKFVIADIHGITRVFNNLIQNALRYGIDGKFIGVSAFSDDINIYFEVYDKGAGVSEKEISKVFERLYKSDSSRSTKGHGLGLAIARELINKMNGEISMESTPYVKTVVKVSMPKSKKK